MAERECHLNVIYVQVFVKQRQHRCSALITVSLLELVHMCRNKLCQKFWQLLKVTNSWSSCDPAATSCDAQEERTFHFSVNIFPYFLSPRLFSMHILIPSSYPLSVAGFLNLDTKHQWCLDKLRHKNSSVRFRKMRMGFLIRMGEVGRKRHKWRKLGWNSRGLGCTHWTNQQGMGRTNTRLHPGDSCLCPVSEQKSNVSQVK